MLKLLNLLLKMLNLLFLKLLIVVGYYVLWRIWSSFIETYESVVAEDVCCRLHYVLWISLVLLKLLNLLLKLLIVVGYYVIWRTLVLLNLLLKLLIVVGYYEL